MNRDERNEIDPRGTQPTGDHEARHAGADPADGAESASDRTLRREHAKLMRMYEAFDQNHDQLRERLLAALPAGAPVPTASTRRRVIGELLMRYVLNRAVAVILAPAACILIALTIIFSNGHTNAFAQAIERLRAARTIVAHFESYLNGAEQPLQSGTMYLAQDQGMRFEADLNVPLAAVAGGAGGPGKMLIFQKSGSPLVMLQPALKFGLRIHTADEKALEGTDWDAASPDRFLDQFRRMADKADRSLGRSTRDGREVEGFAVSARSLGFEFAGGPESAKTDAPFNSEARIWVDAQTHLPVRVEMEILTQTQILGQAHVLAVYDNFQFDAPLEASLFDPPIPADLHMAELNLPPISEQTLIDALKLCQELNGSYPPSLDTAAVAAQLAYNIVRTGGKLQDDDLSSVMSSGLMQKVLDVSMGCAFVQKLARDGKEPEYFGADVTAEDAKEILLRWRQDDGAVRVIYGDLRAETLPGKAATPAK